MAFANNLRYYRKKSGFSRKEMAEKLNISEPSFGFYEQGRTQPNISQLITIASMLNVSTDKLLDIDVDEFERSKSLWIASGCKVSDYQIGNVKFGVEVLLPVPVEQISVDEGKTKIKQYKMLYFNDKKEFIRITKKLEMKVQKEIEHLEKSLFKTAVNSIQTTNYVSFKDGVKIESIRTTQ